MSLSHVKLIFLSFRYSLHHPSIDMVSNSTIPYGHLKTDGSSNLGTFIAAGNYDPYPLHTALDRGNVLNRGHLTHLNYPNQLYAPYYLNHNQGHQMNRMESIEMSRAEKMVIAARNSRQNNS